MIEFDDAGYPTTRTLYALSARLDELAKAKDFTALKRLVQQELSDAAENSPCASGGYVDRNVRGDIMRLWSFSTGGWSGNEDIVDTILGAASGIVRFMWLEVRERGGHYYFNWSRGGD